MTTARPWLSTDMCFLDTFSADFIADELPEIEAWMDKDKLAEDTRQREHLQGLKQVYADMMASRATAVHQSSSETFRMAIFSSMYFIRVNAMINFNARFQQYKFTPYTFRRSVLLRCRNQPTVEHSAAAMDAAAHIVNVMMPRVSYQLTRSAAGEDHYSDPFCRSIKRLPYVEDAAAISATPQSRTTAAFHILSAMAYWLDAVHLDALNDVDAPYHSAYPLPAQARMRRTYALMRRACNSPHDYLTAHYNSTDSPHRRSQKLTDAFHDLGILAGICSMFTGDDPELCTLEAWESFIDERIMGTARGQYLLYGMLRSRGLNDERMHPNIGDTSQQHWMLLDAARTLAPRIYKQLYEESGRPEVALYDRHAVVSYGSEFAPRQQQQQTSDPELLRHYNMLTESAYRAIPLASDTGDDWNMDDGVY